MVELHWTTVHLVWRGPSHRFHARNPFPPGGVIEAPATGAAAAAFGGYLHDLQLVDPRETVTILQGQEMGSPCRLLVDVQPDSDRIKVSGLATRLANPAGPLVDAPV